MAFNIERERKFLVMDPTIIEDAAGESITQGYLTDGPISVRVRVTAEGATLTAKGPRVEDRRVEHECEIPQDIALLILEACDSALVSKMRYPLVAEDRLWVVDVFQDANDGLILAEIELSIDDETDVTLPSWCGKEVTEDERYYNDYLSRCPFGTWHVGG